MSINVSGLVHRYPNSAPDDISVIQIPQWEVPIGTQLLLRGVSGSGKTTLFNILAGLLTPVTGEINYDGTLLYEQTEAIRDRFRAANIGYIYQNHFLLGTLTALQNVEVPMAAARISARRTWRKQAEHLLEQVGLGHRLHHYPYQLSTGQRMRVAIARALANKPCVILADEPTASLDNDASEVVMDLLQRYSEENGAILIVASHDPALSPRFTTALNLRAGQLEPCKGTQTS